MTWRRFSSWRKRKNRCSNLRTSHSILCLYLKLSWTQWTLSLISWKEFSDMIRIKDGHLQWLWSIHLLRENHTLDITSQEEITTELQLMTLEEKIQWAKGLLHLKIQKTTKLALALQKFSIPNRLLPCLNTCNSNPHSINRKASLPSISLECLVIISLNRSSRSSNMIMFFLVDSLMPKFNHTDLQS